MTVGVMRLAAVVAVLLLLAGCGGARILQRTVTVTKTVTSPASAAPTGASFIPACAHPSYGADGNVSPLFCRVDNPFALRYYGSAVSDLMALGPNASPRAVERVSNRDHAVPHSWACSEYALAAWAEHWHFGSNPIPDC